MIVLLSIRLVQTISCASRSSSISCVCPSINRFSFIRAPRTCYSVQLNRFSSTHDAQLLRAVFLLTKTMAFPHSWLPTYASLRYGGQQVGKHSHIAQDDELFVAYAVGACLLVVIAGLMSGLTLGLMSLDSVELEVRYSPSSTFVSWHRTYYKPRS
jgi:hypothetical protein